MAEPIDYMLKVKRKQQGGTDIRRYLEWQYSPLTGNHRQGNGSVLKEKYIEKEKEKKRMRTKQEGD